MAKEMIVERAVTINKNSSDVFQYLKICRNQEYFSVWNMKDPNKKTHCEGIDGTVGFFYSWDSKEKSVGAGSQTIAQIVEGESITFNLVFERPMKNTGTSTFTITSLAAAQTKVSWAFRGPTKFPMSLFTGLIQKMLGKDIAMSLDNLKKNFEG